MRRYAGLVTAIALSLSAAMPARAATPIPIESFILANGMEVVVISNHRVPAVSHMVWYRVGAGDDPPGKSGLAHYHEHMMYQGTGKYKPNEYSDIIARQGGQENAFTGYDATSYFVNISKDQLPLAMELEADRMRGLKPSDANIAKEKEVIIEERRLRIENRPEAVLDEQINATLFRHHPYHLPVIGWMHEMEKLTKEDVLTFHNNWYHPNNAILIVSGDVTGAEVKKLAEKYYGNLPKKPVPPRRWNEEPPQRTERRVTLRHKNVKQAAWTRVYAAPSIAYGNKDQTLPLYVLSEELGEGKTSRLYRTLVVEKKLATNIDVDYSGFLLGPGQFAISAIPEQSVSMEKLEKAVDEELKKILDEGFTDEGLARARTLLKAETLYARDGLTSMARIMGWLRIAGLEPDYFNRWPDMIDSVKAAQVTQAARDVLKIDQSVTGLLLPEEGGKP